ncbi:MAG: hypothetical protein DWQ18_04465 [Crenarchaeota archaeon]|nr:MAG: hypothetical protein DWQ17_08665 [Thermoproteota archaeon]RDJ34155.1 MAG: hypothetical protein DWQ18_04465 [Thermoproteota archaeon]RDJ36729.1 MAG: hypothetical protein DWQ13_06145 [Thermoproteota archaeon]RDJ37737.1 MAG: hypothetical protein DWQ19_04690 [Thermoproteota archaeon]
MRLGNRTNDEFIQSLNQTNEQIQNSFLEHIKELTNTVKIKVMLGDSTITEQSTFDPKKISDYYKKITESLENWQIQDISISNNEDVRRIFTKFETKIGNYIISGHLSIQFHVLLYYRPDNRVIKIQKELADLIDNTKDKEIQLSEMGDEFVLSKLKEMGYTNLTHQNLFEIFYDNDELREKIYNEVEGKTDVNFKELSNKKTQLFNELDSFLLETYQTSPVLIDDTKLIAGEEGSLCTFDLEFVKNNVKEGLFDPKKISEKTKQGIIQTLEQFLLIISKN